MTFVTNDFKEGISSVVDLLMLGKRREKTTCSTATIVSLISFKFLNTQYVSKSDRLH